VEKGDLESRRKEMSKKNKKKEGKLTGLFTPGIGTAVGGAYY
jgi:hypothetical protein